MQSPSLVTLCTSNKVVGEFSLLYSLYLSVVESHRKEGDIPRLQDAAAQPILK